MFSRLRRKLTISLVTFIAIFVVGELVTRALEPGPYALFDSYPYVAHELGQGFERHEANFSGRWDGTWYETNDLGLRGGEVAAPAADQLRVVCLGDSCTFGKGVSEEGSWPRQLEQQLAAEAGGAWQPVVANLGVNGYHGASYLKMFEEVGADLAPDVVLVGFNLNDFPNAISAVDEKVFKDRSTRRMIPKGLRDSMGRSSLYRWARQTFYHMRREADWANAETFAAGVAKDDADSPVWRKQREILAEIKAAAEAQGARMAVFLFPYESQLYMDVYDTTPIERLRALCDEIEVPYVDLAESFRAAIRADASLPNLFLRGDRYHPTPAGYGLVAKRVALELKNEGWLPKPAEEQ
jgi:lysophospholipase L1-like esterase